MTKGWIAVAVCAVLMGCSESKTAEPDGLGVVVDVSAAGWGYPIRRVKYPDGYECFVLTGKAIHCFKGPSQ
jgi:hypothetical protein